MREERKKPTVKGGLERGAKSTAELASSKEGRRLLLTVVGSMFWLFFLMPSSCMKLTEAFPGTGVGFFTGLAMYVAWVAFLIILKKKGRPITWPKMQKPKRTVYVRQTRVEITAVRKAGSFPLKETERPDSKDEIS